MAYKEQFVLYKNKNSFDSDKDNLKSTTIAFVSEEGKEAIHTQNHTFNMVPEVPDIDNNTLIKTNSGAAWSNIDMQDLLSYGVRISKSQDGRNLVRTGNLDLHRSLPIQSGMYGVMVESTTKEVKHFINPNDWRYGVEQYDINDIIIPGTLNASISSEYALRGTENLTITFYANMATSEEYLANNQKYMLSSYILYNNSMYKIVEAKSTDNVDTIEIVAVLDDIESTNNWTTIANNINTYGLVDAKLCVSCSGVADWNTMVYIPGFYIKSWETDEYNEVRISENYIDDTWGYYPPVLMGAYFCSKEKNVNKVKSICNGYYNYLGYVGNSSFYNTDTNPMYTTDPVCTYRCKPYYHTSYDDTTQLISNNNSKEITYNAFTSLYWLYVIEYASCWIGSPFNNSLDSQQFHQGGIGPLLSMPESFSVYGHSCNIIGSTDRYGNNSGNCNASYTSITKPLRDLSILNFFIYSSNCNYVRDYTNKTLTLTKINTNTYNIMFISPMLFSGSITFVLSGDTAGKTFKLKKGSEVIATIGDSNNTATVNIDWYNTYLFIQSDFIGDCNVTFMVLNAEPSAIETPVNLYSSRYRGIEDITGTIGFLLDKVVSRKEDTRQVLYSCDNIKTVSDTDIPHLNKVGEYTNIGNLPLQFLTVGNNAGICGKKGNSSNYYGWTETNGSNNKLYFVIAGGTPYYYNLEKSMISTRNADREATEFYQIGIRILMNPSEYNLQI